MIYGAQQTIKLIRLCVFPEEGPAGGCSRPSPAPSLVEPPLPSLQRHRGGFCLVVPTSALLQQTCEGVLLVCPERLRHRPRRQRGAEADRGVLLAGLWLFTQTAPT